MSTSFSADRVADALVPAPVPAPAPAIGASSAWARGPSPGVAPAATHEAPLDVGASADSARHARNIIRAGVLSLLPDYAKTADSAGDAREASLRVDVE